VAPTYAKDKKLWKKMAAAALPCSLLDAVSNDYTFS
jgi:hypothetical protein